MYRYKRVLVNLSLNDDDLNLVKISSEISRMSKSEKFYFLFTEKRMDIPAEVIKEYPQLTESVADFAREKISTMVAEVFGRENLPEIQVIIQEGEILDEVLKQIRLNGIDLALVATSRERPDSLNIALKLARKAPCSVLVVPEKSNLSLENPAVAVDFSEYAADAMDAAVAFTKSGKGRVLNMIHAYQVPTGYHKTGKSYEEFEEIMQIHAQNRFADFKKPFDGSGLQIREHYQSGSRNLESIKQVIERENISFLATGARGRSAGASVMLGSVTERLIEQLNIPVLAVKKKGTGMNILEAIFN